MVTTRCLICNNEALRTYVDTGLNKGLSARGIAAGLESAGGKIDPDVISRHRSNHWTPPPPPAGAPQPTKRDLAILLRDRVAEAVEQAKPRTTLVHTEDGMVMEERPFDILDKELAPALSAGLKAQALMDKRDQESKKLGLAAGALGFQMYLASLGRETDPPELDDGNTIDGEATEVG